MQREALEKLVAWKSSKTRKPLLVYGARQVGKSYLLSEFGAQYYKHVVSFDLERQSSARTAFDGDLSPKTIVSTLSQISRQDIVPGETLVILDEIQASNRALASLKYFAEETPELHVVAAGSLLGVAVKRDGFSAPVGKVDTLTLHPMSFEEYLNALGEQRMVQEIRACFSECRPYALHQGALNLYFAYLLVGGMPEAVNRYVQSRDFQEVKSVQHDILDLYVADMAKYADPLETARIREAWASVPSQLAKENHKFQYNAVRSGGRANRYESALDWLETAGLVNRCVLVTSGQTPLRMQEDRAFFKIYMSDTGLLSAASELSPAMVLDAASRSAVDLSGITENYVAQALVANGHTPRYWTSSGKAEVDFVIDNGTAHAVPLEVKSSDNVRSRSLGEFRRKYNTPLAMRFSTKNFGQEDGLVSIPLYAAFCLEK